MCVLADVMYVWFLPSRDVAEGWDASLKTSSYLENGKKREKRNVRQILGNYQLFIVLLGKSFSRNYLVGKKNFFSILPRASDHARKMN